MAGLYVLAGADFLAITQILVYVGGILVILIFGVMLTNQKGNKENGKNDILSGNANKILGFVIAITIFTGLFYTFARANFTIIQSQLFVLTEPSATTKTIGINLMTDFVLPFEVSGILLMATLIGAAYLSLKSNNNA